MLLMTPANWKSNKAAKAVVMDWAWVELAGRLGVLRPVGKRGLRVASRLQYPEFPLINTSMSVTGWMSTWIFLAALVLPASEREVVATSKSLSIKLPRGASEPFSRKESPGSGGTWRVSQSAPLL